MKRLLAILTVVLGTLLVLTGTAFAGVLPAPRLQEGVFVYTIPHGFDPPLIGRSGMREMDREIQKRHHPFFVVLIERASMRNGRDLSVEIDGLAEDWQNRQSDLFDAAHSQIFLLSYSPRKYQFLAGSMFRMKLGFEKERMRPYAEIFERSIKGTPKDPKTGILEMAKAVDEYVFDQTDPERIRARQEQVKRVALQKRRDAALGTLNEQIRQMTDLLEDPRDIPADADAYRALLKEAKVIRGKNSLDEMIAFSKRRMQPMLDELDRYVQERRSERSQRIGKIVLSWILGIFLLGCVIGFLVLRRRTLLSLRRELRELIDTWKRDIGNAATRYMNFYGERDWAFALKEAGGRTQEIFASVTKEVDTIYAIVRAMEARVLEAEKIGKKGNYFNLRALRRAIDFVTEAFRFDTGVLNPADLFGEPTKFIGIDPRVVTADLRERFKNNHAKWQELKEAAEFQNTLPDDAIPHSDLDALFARADEFGISRDQFSEHPLFGDDASDQEFYAEMNALRLQDPYAYRDRVNEVKALESDLAECLGQLIEAIQSVQAQEERVLSPDTSSIQLDPEDDPMITYLSARREAELFRLRLSSRQSIEEFQAHAQNVVELYQRCAEQVATIRSAMDSAGEVVKTAEARLHEIVGHRSIAQRQSESAERAHIGCRAGEMISEGDRYKESGNRELRIAQGLLSDHRYLNAHRSAHRAISAFANARASYERAVEHCGSLDRKRQEYERKLSNMDSVRLDAASKIRRYNGHESLSAYQAPTLARGPVDYGLLLGQLSAQEELWQSSVRSAKFAYDEEQRRIRRAEEAARRRRIEEEEAARRRSYSYDSDWGSSSSSSSIGGSWGGGGGSSSIGGSW